MNVFAPIDHGKVINYRVVSAMAYTRTGGERKVWDVVAVYENGHSEAVERFDTKREANGYSMNQNRALKYYNK